jgi:hypothetical protein
MGTLQKINEGNRAAKSAGLLGAARRGVNAKDDSIVE